MRAQMHNYVRGLPQARQLRGAANKLSTLAQLRALVEQYLVSIQEGPRASAHGDGRAGADLG